MAVVTVTPEEFELVFYEAEVIASLVGSVADELGIESDVEVCVEIDETSPLARWTTSSVDPLTLTLDGGAFEDTREPRRLSEDRLRDVVGRFLLKAIDRRGSFAEAPADDELTLAESVAWDVYSVARLVRMGHPGQRQRRLYQFWNRHGFTDAANEAFEELWAADGLTWDDVDRISRGAREAAQV
jgi:hypothetical protein